MEWFFFLFESKAKEGKRHTAELIFFSVVVRKVDGVQNSRSEVHSFLQKKKKKMVLDGWFFFYFFLDMASDSLMTVSLKALAKMAALLELSEIIGAAGIGEREV